ADFIPVAEDTGLIVEIGNWVFFNVADQIAKWRESIDESFQVSINKSPVQFYNKDNKLSAWFEYMKKIDIPGSSLVVEITEGLMLNENSEVSDKLLAFRDEGVQVAVDDFGTGYSSLSYLKKFDVDYIKIDKSFIQNLSIYSEDMVLCEAIIVMAHKLGLKVIAEGVETIEQRDLLFAVGCDYGQGYLFSRPVPADELEKLSVAQNELERDAPPIYESMLRN
ncbi:MAG: EAL domain-containing protein, partial [Methylophilaceae bacterium]